METYECVICGNYTEIEKENNSEAYEFSECQSCFDRTANDPNEQQSGEMLLF